MKPFPPFPPRWRYLAFLILCITIPLRAQENVYGKRKAAVRTQQFFAGLGGGLVTGVVVGLTSGLIAGSLMECGDHPDPDEDDLACGLTAGFIGVAGAGVGLFAGTAVWTYVPGRVQGGDGSLAATFLGSGLGMTASGLLLYGSGNANPLSVACALVLPAAGALAFYQMTDRMPVSFSLVPEIPRNRKAYSARPSLRADLRLMLARF